MAEVSNGVFDWIERERLEFQRLQALKANLQPPKEPTPQESFVDQPSTENAQERIDWGKTGVKILKP